MSHCPAVDIANQMVTDLTTAVEADEFSLDFEARAIMGHAVPELDSEWFHSPKVDIVPPPDPQLVLQSRGDFKYDHVLTFMVGLRQRITNQHINPSDESFNLTAMATLLDTFYELMFFFMPTGANPQGTKIVVTPWVAVTQSADIAFLWNPELLAKKLYCGVFNVTMKVTEQSPQT